MSFIEQWLHDAVPALVGGQWRKGQQTFAVDNPATGETIAHVADFKAFPHQFFCGFGKA